MVVVVVEAALAPANMSIDNDAANVEGPTDDEAKTVRPESNATVKNSRYIRGYGRRGRS